MSTPIIICAKIEAAAKAIKEVLQPEFEVIYKVSSPETGLEEIGQIFKGEAPAGAEGNIGTGNFSAPPKAVLCSTGWDDEWIKKLSTQSGVPVVKPADQIVPAASGGPDPAVVKMVGERAKAALQKLADEGKLAGGNSGIYGF